MKDNNIEQQDLDIEDVKVEDSPEVDVQDGDGGSEPDTFPREYVEKLRKESAAYRDRAKRTDELEQQVDDLQQRLHVALVRLDGRLADPEDLELDAERLADPEALEAAITALLETKPGLRAKIVAGDVGAGARGAATSDEVDLIEFIRRC